MTDKDRFEDLFSVIGIEFLIDISENEICIEAKVNLEWTCFVFDLNGKLNRIYKY